MEQLIGRYTLNSFECLPLSLPSIKQWYVLADDTFGSRPHYIPMPMSEYRKADRVITTHWKETPVSGNLLELLCK